ncbi:L-amino acid N-acyltransferase YncA [Carnobacterium alterfunditum]|uniref:L-amino acid N-acyltransferase YncA n=1 Tax=Carnobacterium alterfunditum TaxID=28230 RepID=A0A1N6F2C8_9LACT|nr:GNAT family protein [Carnobacterium alterfunditum]SIN89393.1 L-amino acid N-acyltransferase YncA [Carnobacterium alterfunditum]
MNWIIRLSEQKDFPQLRTIENQIWHSGNTPHVTTYETVADYQKHYSAGSQLVALAADSQEIAGFLGFHPPTNLMAHQKVWGVDVGVHPAFQGKGVGTDLLTAIKALAVKQGIHKLSLRVLSTNPAAIHLYQKNGFQVEGRLKNEFWIEGQFIDDLLMAYFLD